MSEYLGKVQNNDMVEKVLAVEDGGTYVDNKGKLVCWKYTERNCNQGFLADSDMHVRNVEWGTPGRLCREEV